MKVRELAQAVQRLASCMYADGLPTIQSSADAGSSWGVGAASSNPRPLAVSLGCAETVKKWAALCVSLTETAQTISLSSQGRWEKEAEGMGVFAVEPMLRWIPEDVVSTKSVGNGMSEW